MARTVFFNGHWTGYEPRFNGKDIVKHGASQSIKDFIAGNFSGTTPVTDGNNMNNYSDKVLDPNDLEEMNNFNPEIEDVFVAKQNVAAAEAMLMQKKADQLKAAQLAKEQEFARYKKYYEDSQKKTAE